MLKVVRRDVVVDVCAFEVVADVFEMGVAVWISFGIVFEIFSSQFASLMRKN